MFERYIKAEATVPEVLLLWRNDKSVICGKYQNVFREINMREVMQQDIAVIRRGSGGGTVYHDLGNINYAIISESTRFGTDYLRYLSPVVSALNSLGIPAVAANACDIDLFGKKISGSAQCRKKNAVLHHGTLLFSADLAQMSLALKNDGVYSSKGIASVRRDVTNIRELLNISVEEFVPVFEDALCRQLSISEIIDADTFELSDIDTYSERYKDFDYTFGSSPAFTCTRNNIAYSVKEGKIIESSFSEPIRSVLNGCRLLPKDLRERLKNEPEKTIIDVLNRIF